VHLINKQSDKITNNTQQLSYCLNYICIYFIAVTVNVSALLGYLLMIASYTAPSALVQTVRPCKGTWKLDSLERWSSAWVMKFNTKKNVKLCPSPVESPILPICITYVVTYCPVSR